MWGFQKTAHGLPGITSRSPFIAHRKRLRIEGHDKMIFKCGGTAVHHTWKKKPETQHQDEPEKGSYEKGQGKYLFKIEKKGRSQRENIHQYDHDPDLLPAQKMIAKGL